MSPSSLRVAWRSYFLTRISALESDTEALVPHLSFNTIPGVGAGPFSGSSAFPTDDADRAGALRALAGYAE